MNQDTGDLDNIAKLYNDMGQKYEEDSNIDNALECYEKALTYYKCIDGKSQSMKLYEKLGYLLSQYRFDYNTAVAYFEECAKLKVNIPLLKFTATDVFTSAILCTLISDDLVLVNKNIHDYKEIDYTLESSTKFKHVSKLVSAYEDLNMDAFMTCITDWDSSMKFNNWQTGILLKIRTNLALKLNVDNEVDIT